MRRKKTGQKQLQAGKREPPRILSFGEGPRRIFSLSHCEKRAAVTRTERYISTTTWNPVENCPTASRRAATRVRRPLLTAAVHQGLGEVPTSILQCKTVFVYTKTLLATTMRPFRPYSTAFSSSQTCVLSGRKSWNPNEPRDNFLLMKLSESQ